MSITNGMNRIIAVLNIPQSIAALISYAKGIVSAVTNNKNFVAPVPSPADITKSISGLEDAESIVHTKVIGSVKARDVKKQVLLKDLRALLAYVQGIADNDTTNAQSIILSAGIGIKQAPVRTKPAFDAKHGTSGSVNLVVKSAGQRSAYEWNMSTDGIKWDYLPTTILSKTMVGGLIPGINYFFRYRVVKTEGISDWSQSLNLIAI
jgi:hypothetical protein